MSDIRLTRKQIQFLMDRLGEEDPEKAAETFISLMVAERAPSADICVYIDKIIDKLAKEKK